MIKTLKTNILCNLAHLVKLSESWLETVDFQFFISQCHPYAVFTESGRTDVQLSQYFLYGRMGISVTFQFDNHQIIHRTSVIRDKIMELQLRINGESFGKVTVHQSDAGKTVFHPGRKVSR